MTTIRFDAEGAAWCRACNTKLVYANDAKAGETVAVTCKTPGCPGNIARASAPDKIISFRPNGAAVLADLEDRRDVKIPFQRLRGGDAQDLEIYDEIRLTIGRVAYHEIAKQVPIGYVADLEVTLQRVTDAYESLVRSDYEGRDPAQPRVVKMLADGGVTEARAILAKLKASRQP
jgi:hypothetical protein